MIAFTIVEKFSPVFRSKRIACVVSITAIANVWNFVLGSFMLALRDLLLEPIKKRQLIYSQVARIILFALEFQFLLDT